MSKETQIATKLNAAAQWYRRANRSKENKSVIQCARTAERRTEMIALDLTPTEEAQICTAAQQTGLAPAEYIKKLVKEHLLPVQSAAVPAVDEENAAAIALLESWIAAAPTDPEEIRQAEADLNEFMENLNRNRIESGERPLLP